MATPQAETPQSQPALRGRRILICRPEPEGARLAVAFRAAGAQVRLLPTVTREPLPETPERRSILQALDNFQHVIAVSPYAARLLLDEVDQWWPQPPIGVQWYGVGAGTAAVFAEAGLPPERPEQGWTSEALLIHPALQNLEHQRVLLARGEQGRELIRETLEQRGARVTVLPLYRRLRPYYPADTIKEIFTEFRPEAVIALSGETLNNLKDMAPEYQQTLAHALVVVPAERIVQQARKAGFSNPVVPAGLSDRELVISVASRLGPPAGDNGKPSKDARD